LFGLRLICCGWVGYFVPVGCWLVVTLVGYVGWLLLFWFAYVVTVVVHFGCWLVVTFCWLHLVGLRCTLFYLRLHVCCCWFGCVVYLVVVGFGYTFCWLLVGLLCVAFVGWLVGWLRLLLLVVVCWLLRLFCWLLFGYVAVDCCYVYVTLLRWLLRCSTFGCCVVVGYVVTFGWLLLRLVTFAVTLVVWLFVGCCYVVVVTFCFTFDWLRWLVCCLRLRLVWLRCLVTLRYVPLRCCRLRYVDAFVCYVWLVVVTRLVTLLIVTLVVVVVVVGYGCWFTLVYVGCWLLYTPRCRLVTVGCGCLRLVARFALVTCPVVGYFTVGLRCTVAHVVGCYVWLVVWLVGCCCYVWLVTFGYVTWITLYLLFTVRLLVVRLVGSGWLVIHTLHTHYAHICGWFTFTRLRLRFTHTRYGWLVTVRLFNVVVWLVYVYVWLHTFVYVGCLQFTHGLHVYTFTHSGCCGWLFTFGCYGWLVTRLRLRLRWILPGYVYGSHTLFTVWLRFTVYAPRLRLVTFTFRLGYVVTLRLVTLPVGYGWVTVVWLRLKALLDLVTFGWLLRLRCWFALRYARLVGWLVVTLVPVFGLRLLRFIYVGCTFTPLHTLRLRFAVVWFTVHSSLVGSVYLVIILPVPCR